MVDGKSLVGLGHDEAVAVLRATQKLVQLVVASDHNEGESVTSSLQSIPEKLANRVTLVGGLSRKQQQYQQLQQPPSVDTTITEPCIEPEMLEPPQINGYNDDTAMELLPLVTSLRSEPEEEMETKFTGEESSADGHVDRVVQLTRTEEGQTLGLSIKTSRGRVLVRHMDPEGLVGIDGRLQEGDQLLQVNGVSLETSNKTEAISILSVSAWIMYDLHDNVLLKLC